MTKITTDQAALARIQKKLGTIAEFNRRARVPMEQSLALLQDELQDYPKKDPNAFSKMATDKQRRAYFAKMPKAQKEAGKKNPAAWGYRRTKTLGRSWTAKITRSAGKQIAGAFGLRGEVGTNNPYAKWVQQFSNQQPFHRASGWVHEVQVIRRKKNDIHRIWARWIKRELSR
jgi:hypothetical protein